MTLFRIILNCILKILHRLLSFRTQLDNSINRLLEHIMNASELSRRQYNERKAN